MLACIIMHNMIIEDEQGLDLEHLYDVPVERGSTRRDFTFQDLHAGTREIEDINSHYALCNDVIDHLWMRKGHRM